MSFRDGSEGRRGRGFNRRRGKSPAIGRGDSGRHQASDEVHASSFSYRGRGRVRRRSSFENTQCFYYQKNGQTIKFIGRKLKMRRRKNQASCTSEKRREDDILFLACNVEKNCI